MSSQSPLKAKPLRVPGESLDKEIDRWVIDTALGYCIAAALLCALAAMEWVGYFTHAPRKPILFSIVAAVAVAVGVWRIWGVRAQVRRLKLGRDGERVVGQFLERLRHGGPQALGVRRMRRTGGRARPPRACAEHGQRSAMGLRRRGQ
jgi:hypothetical protein